MKKKPLGVLASLALLSGIAPSLAGQKPERPSPQQKIVKKYGLQEKLKEALETGEGCHQPIAGSDEEKTFKDFRKLVERANIPDALLLFCDALDDGYKHEIDARANITQKIIAVQNFLNLTPKEQAYIAGHEITHVINGDTIENPNIELTEHTRFLEEVTKLALTHVLVGNPLSRAEFARLERQEAAILARADKKIGHNQKQEETADLGGLILNAGPSCKLDPDTMESALRKTLAHERHKVDSHTHGGLQKRIDTLRKNQPAIEKACNDYYRNVKMNKPNKQPPGNGR